MFTALLVAVSIAALLSAEERAVLAVPVLASALACGLRLVRRLRIPEPVWTLASLLALAFFVFNLTAWSRRSSLVAGTELLLYVLPNKVYHLRTTRDMDQLLAVTFFMVLAVCVLAVEAVVVFFFLVYLFVALRVMELLHQRREEEAGLVPVALTEPQGAVLLQARSRSGSTRAVVLATAAVIAVAVPLFFAFPRIGTGMFSTNLLRPQHVSGFSGEVDLDDIRSIQEDPTLVGRVRPESPSGRKLALLRAIGFRAFDGRRWKRDEGRPDLRRRDPGRMRFVVGDTARADGLDWFEVTAGVLSPPVLPVPVRPVFVEAPLASLQRDAAGTLTFAQERNAPPHVTYRVAADLEEPPSEAMAEGEDPPALRRYLQLPKLAARVEALAREIAPADATRLETARAIERRLVRDYRYSLDLDPSPKALESFLFERKAGHCELFATAMAVLLRARGIPARVVNGFRLTEWSDLGEYFIVRQSDAHAWVEVYFPKGGWATFDPTPPDPERGGASDSALRWLSHLADFAMFKWDRYVISWSLVDQRALLDSAMESVREIPGALAELRRSLDGSHAPGAIAAGLVLAMVAIAGLRALRRRRGLTPEREATALYQALRAELARAGVAIAPSTAPGELLARFGAEPHAREVLDLYIGTRFAGEAPDAAALRSARRALRGVRTGVRAGGQMEGHRVER